MLALLRLRPDHKREVFLWNLLSAAFQYPKADRASHKRRALTKTAVT